MSSRKTRHKASRHSTPLSCTSGGRTCTLPARATHQSYHATPILAHSSYPTDAPSYHILVPQVIDEFDHAQFSLHQDPTYLHNVQAQYTNQLETCFNTLGVELPVHMHTRTVQDTIGMIPSERFEAHSTYPYQQYNSYQPISSANDNSCHLHHQGQYANVANHPEAQHGQCVSSSVHAAASSPGSRQMYGRDVVYFAPQKEYFSQPTAPENATDPGNDLAAIGAQFDGQMPSGYGQIF